MSLAVQNGQIVYLAVSKALLVLKWPGHFETYLNRVNKAVFCNVNLIVKGSNRLKVLVPSNIT